MLATDTPITVAAQAVAPYLHLDNRGLVIYDGRRAVMFAAATLGWVAETIDILLAERRATRTHRDHVLGGFVEEDGTFATLYAGPADDLATLRVDTETLAMLGQRLRSR